MFDDGVQGYSLGRSSRMEAILKNQLRHVSLAVSFTSSTVNESEQRGNNSGHIRHEPETQTIHPSSVPGSNEERHEKVTVRTW